MKFRWFVVFKMPNTFRWAGALSKRTVETTALSVVVEIVALPIHPVPIFKISKERNLRK